MVASLITSVEANHFDARADHVATVSLAHEVMVLVVGCVVLVLVTPPLESARGLHRSTKASARMSS